jgi:hypothetical protein
MPEPRFPPATKFCIEFVIFYFCLPSPSSISLLFFFFFNVFFWFPEANPEVSPKRLAWAPFGREPHDHGPRRPPPLPEPQPSRFGREARAEYSPAWGRLAWPIPGPIPPCRDPQASTIPGCDTHIGRYPGQGTGWYPPIEVDALQHFRVSKTNGNSYSFLSFRLKKFVFLEKIWLDEV